MVQISLKAWYFFIINSYEKLVKLKAWRLFTISWSEKRLFTTWWSEKLFFLHGDHRNTYLLHDDWINANLKHFYPTNANSWHNDTSGASLRPYYQTSSNKRPYDPRKKLYLPISIWNKTKLEDINVSYLFEKVYIVNALNWGVAVYIEILYWHCSKVCCKLLTLQ